MSPRRDDARPCPSAPVAGRRFLPVFRDVVRERHRDAFRAVPDIERRRARRRTRPARSHGARARTGRRGCRRRHQGRDARAFVAAARWAGLSGVGSVGSGRSPCRRPVGRCGLRRAIGAGDRDGLRTTLASELRGRDERIDVLRSVDGVERVRSPPSDVSDRARRQSRHRDLCLIQNRRNRAGDDALPAGVELCRQRRALDLSDRAAPSSGGVERFGLGAFVRGPDWCGCGRRDRRVAA